MKLMEKDPGVLPCKTDPSPFLLVHIPSVFRATDVIQLLKEKYLWDTAGLQPEHGWADLQVWEGFAGEGQTTIKPFI